MMNIAKCRKKTLLYNAKWLYSDPFFKFIREQKLIINLQD